MKKNSDFNSNWLFIVPISGLWLTTTIKNELKVGNVIFVSKDKLPKIRRRLGIPVPVSQLCDIGLDNPTSFKKRVKGYFTYSKTYAILSFSGVPKENYTENIRIIEDAIHLISFSNLGLNTRKFNSKIQIKNSETLLHTRTLTIDKKRKRLTLGNKSSHPLPFEISERWNDFHKDFFYHKFLDIVNGKKKINSKWRNLLISVGKLVGKSLNSHDIPESFLKNMIAIEMLLVGQSEKIENKIIERSAYLLDWYDKWENDEIEERITKIYKKRCNYVHDGKHKEITKEDLIFTDDLIFNIFNNIIKNINQITSKGKLIEFSDKYQCEKQLNIKSKFQFGKFQYVSKTYEKNDFEKL